MSVTLFRHEALISKGRNEDGTDHFSAVEEYFYCDEELHREDGPAVIKHDYAFGITEEHFYWHGKRHRKNGPAVVIRTLDGTREEYYRNGERHCEDGPAISVSNRDGSTVEEYHRDGKLDRTDGPAIVIRNSDGSTVEEYYRNGGLHRKNGPQIVKRFADGSTEENYCEDGEDRLRHGRLHRFDGPASIVRNADGSLKEERYYHGGVPRDIKSGPAVVKHNADGTTVREYSRYGTTIKTEYLDKEGVVVKTEGLTPSSPLYANYYPEVALGADKGLTGTRVALEAAKPEQPATRSVRSGPNRYSELTKATPQSGIANAPRTTQKPRTPGMAP